MRRIGFSDPRAVAGGAGRCRTTLQSLSMDDHGRRPPGGPSDETHAADLVKLTVWIEREMDERLRRRALRDATTEAALVREALRHYFGDE